MALDKQAQKTEISNQRSNCSIENFTVSFVGLKDFYRAVKILNLELGHGNWTTQGRPVRKLRRLEMYNAFHAPLTKNTARSHDVVFCVPGASNYLASRIALELFGDK